MCHKNKTQRSEKLIGISGKMDPLAVLDKALIVASVIKDQIVAFKNCPPTIKQAGEETLSCVILLEEAKKNSMLPKDKLLTAVKPIGSVRELILTTNNFRLWKRSKPTSKNLKIPEVFSLSSKLPR